MEEDKKIKKRLYDEILSTNEIKDSLIESIIGCYSNLELQNIIESIIDCYPNFKLQNILDLLKYAQKYAIPIYKIIAILELGTAGSTNLKDLFPVQNNCEAISSMFNYISSVKNKNIIAYFNIFKDIPVVEIIFNYIMPPQCIGGYG